MPLHTCHFLKNLSKLLKIYYMFAQVLATGVV